MTGACAGSQAEKPLSTLDRGDRPDDVRPAYGNSELHTWWPLTGPEIAAVQGVAQAKQGDVHALLALAILASGGERDAASYASYQQRVDRFLSDMKPAMEAAADDWHRGYELHRAMHRVFFGGERSELASYDINQSRIADIFKTGHYNCLSSALLFAVLARGFNLSVRGVLVPTHAFIEMGEPGGKLIEVETTSATGFDWVHDDRFYKEAAAQWSSNRGLRPATLDDYRQRKILEPYRLMAAAMRNSYVGESDQDRFRLTEVAALIDADDVEIQLNRIVIYNNEAYSLFQDKAWRTIVKLFDTVRPTVSETAATSKDSKTLEMVSWTNWDYATALVVVGRQDEAIALMNNGLDHLDPSWSDAEKLKANYLSILNNLLYVFIEKKDYPTALNVYAKHRDACRSNSVCAVNIGVVYGNWSNQHQNAGDWPSARQVLRECVNELPNDSRCGEQLKDLESRHRF